MHLFLYRLYRATGDCAYAQLLYRLNGNSTADLPKAFCELDADAVQRDVAQVIAEHGPWPKPAGVDFPDWHLAIQRSGEAAHERNLWLDYDSGGMHGHRDALNLGLFSHGLDLMHKFLRGKPCPLPVYSTVE